MSDGIVMSGAITGSSSTPSTTTDASGGEKSTYADLFLSTISPISTAISTAIQPYFEPHMEDFRQDYRQIYGIVYGTTPPA